MFISNSDQNADFDKNNRDALKEHYRQTRENTRILAKPLSPEDQTVQTMPDVSPTKWHLAHTSWFFETFLLKPYLDSYEEKHPAYNYLFNSYYQSVGERWPRFERGLLSRPSAGEVQDYRRHVDAAMLRLINQAKSEVWKEIAPLIILGFNHEWQHQELLLTDIKHVIAHNPLRPAVYQKLAAEKTAPAPSKWMDFDGGIKKIGFCDESENFCFDNETPEHEKIIPPFRLSETLITNGEYLAFMEDGGYQNHALWLSDGWDKKQAEGWCAPLYWRKDENEGWVEFTLSGETPIEEHTPVAHVSYYEAAAYAVWADKRLPREEEAEIAAVNMPVDGNLGCIVKKGRALPVHPAPAQGEGLRQVYGDVWEWTQSPYIAYPGYRAAKTALGEYNGKFMCNQFVLKGGSCATVKNQMRKSYRNFFFPDARWQFSGIRLAEDI